MSNYTHSITFDEWLEKNKHLQDKLRIITYDKKNSFEKFKKERSVIHNKMLKELNNFFLVLDQRKNSVWNDLNELASKEIPDVPYLCTDKKSLALKMRIATFVQQRINKHSNLAFTKVYSRLKELIEDTKQLFSLFYNNIIPENQCCKIVDFFSLNMFNLIEEHHKKIKRYKAYSEKLNKEINQSKMALWESNFPLFLRNLINLAKSKLIEDLSYFSPLEEEVSLSQCFFCYKSEWIKYIDPIVDKFCMTDPHMFISSLLQKCYDLFPKHIKLSTTDQSVCLLLFYRCLFNRCYEKYGSIIDLNNGNCTISQNNTNKYFKDQSEYDSNACFIMKLDKMSKIPAKYFPLPLNLVGKTIQDDSIGELFSRDQYFRKAGNFLEMAMFEPNPIDSLYQIHRALVNINRGAYFNKIGENHSAQKDEMKQLLCFDDMFALLLGTLLGSEKPDIFSVSAMISNYAPKTSLSPSFEYAQANLEALSEHCKKFSIEKCYEELLCDQSSPKKENDKC